MPLPIQKIHDKMSGDGNFYINYSLLLNSIPKESKKIVTASDEDADLLIRLWSSADRISEDVYKVKNNKITPNDILKLKAHGFLTGGSEEVKFTGKAKAIITTMILGESNAFTKEQKKKGYGEIVASMNLKGKKGYRIPKYAANSNLIRIPKNAQTDSQTSQTPDELKKLHRIISDAAEGDPGEENDNNVSRRRHIKVTFNNGDSLETDINGTVPEIRKYYLPYGDTGEVQDYDVSQPDKVRWPVKVEFLS